MPPGPNKRVPANPRYQRVTSRLDTGPNMRKILAQYEGELDPRSGTERWRPVRAEARRGALRPRGGAAGWAPAQSPEGAPQPVGQNSTRT